MAQLIKIKLPDGRVYEPGDWTNAEPLYSTVEVGAGSFPVLTAFSYSAGGTVPGSVGPRQAFITDTNLQGEGNRLPENEELICFNIAVEVFKVGLAADQDIFPDADNPGVPLPDMLRLQRDLLIKFRIAAVKDYTNSPLSYWPAGTGICYVNSGSLSRQSGGASGTVVGNNGGVSPADSRVLASPLYVAGGESLAVDVKAGPGQVVGLNLATTARMRLRIYLDGYRRRPVA
jgi:hypothetical protein